MNRTATPIRLRRPPVTEPTIVATLDLSDDLQRELHAFFQRMHTGRWPALRALAVKQQQDGTIVEAAEWVREKGRRFAVVEWSTRGGLLAWRCTTMPTAKAALSALSVN